MFKVSKNLASLQMQEIFKLLKGTESLSFLGPKIWDILRDTYKDMPNLNRYKLALKRWRPVNCPCRIYQVYIANAGFV